ncbi:MAG: cupin domain-containing protein [Candidatus Omnitrophota bacterium]|jgi:quercetin dioxygenase-like cupin family protein
MVKPKKINNTRAFCLDKAISYEKGAIVSKELVKKEAGTVTLFSFDKGQALSEHTAPFDALLYIIDGEAKVRISKKSHTVKAGQMLIMPANKPHSLSADSRFKMLLVLIKK